MSRRSLTALATAFGLIGAGWGAAGFAKAAWRSVLEYRSPFRFAPGGELPRPGPAGAVFLILIDGLRVDASRTMPFLNELRAQGADFVAAVGRPSYSRPGRATLATGTWPEIHGVSSNHFEGSLDRDSIFRSAAVAFRTCRIAGSKIWPDLFGADIARCGAARGLAENERPGMFEVDRPTLEAEEDAGLAFALAQPADLRILDFVATDAAAHDAGALSEAYRRQTRRIDDLVRRVVEQVGLDGTAFIVTGDHGHRDRGGHGSDEPEIVTVPLILAGPWIRPGARGLARQIDVAPTMAALLGVPIPGTTSGRVLTEALALDGDLRKMADNASTGQQRRFVEQYARTIGTDATKLDNDPERAIVEALSHGVAHERTRRLPATVGLLLVAVGVAWVALRGDASRRAAILAGVTAYVLGVVVLIFATRQPMTLSAINYDEQVNRFFRPFILFGLGAFLAGSAVAVGMSRNSATERFTLVLRLVALVGAAWVGLVAWAYGWAGLFSTWRLASIPTLFTLFVASLQVVAAAAAALLLGLGTLVFGRPKPDC